MLVSATDSVAAALGSALDGLTLRQSVAADNIANMDTPGFTAATVDFESSLRSALADGEMTAPDVVPATGLSADPAGANGNNVQLEDEMVGMMQTNLMKNAMVEAFIKQYGAIRRAQTGESGDRGEVFVLDDGTECDQDMGKAAAKRWG